MNIKPLMMSLAALLVAPAAWAQVPTQLGWWTADPPGQGMRFDHLGGAIEGVWYTYAPSGEPVWYLLLNSQTSDNQIDFDLIDASANFALVGSASVRFSACDQAQFVYQRDDASGVLAIIPFDRYGDQLICAEEAGVVGNRYVGIQQINVIGGEFAGESCLFTWDIRFLSNGTIDGTITFDSGSNEAISVACQLDGPVNLIYSQSSNTLSVRDLSDNAPLCDDDEIETQALFVDNGEFLDMAPDGCELGNSQVSYGASLIRQP